MLARSREDRRDHRERDGAPRHRAPDRASQRRCLGARRMKAKSPATLSTALYFESPARPRPTPATSQRPQVGPRSGGAAKNNRASAQAARAKPNSRAAVGHDPRSGGGEEERGDVQREERDDRGAGAEQVERQTAENPAGRGEQDDERQARRRRLRRTRERRNGRSTDAEGDGRNRRGSGSERSRAYSSHRFRARALQAKTILAARKPAMIATARRFWRSTSFDRPTMRAPIAQDAAAA